MSSSRGVDETSYSIRTARTDSSVTSTQAPVIPPAGGLTEGWIVAIALLSLLVLALIILLIWCLYRVCRRRYITISNRHNNKFITVKPLF